MIWIGETTEGTYAVVTADAEDCNSLCLGSDQEKMFGPTINGLIKRHIEPDRCLLWDSKREGGRPDTMRILKKVYNCWGAEGPVMAFYTACAILVTDACPSPQLFSSHRTTMGIRRSCRVVKRQVFLRLARRGISWVSHLLLCSLLES